MHICIKSVNMQSLSAHFWKNFFLKLLSFQLFDTWMETICSHIAICLLLSPDETFSRNYSPFLFFFFFSLLEGKNEESGNISHKNPIRTNLWYLTVSFCALTLLVLLWREYLQALTGCMPGMIKSKTSSFFCLTQRERFVDKIDLERSVGNCIEGEVVEKYCSWLVSHRGHCHHPAQWIES